MVNFIQMKRSQIILFAVFVVITGLIYITLASNKKEYSKKIKTEDKVKFVPVAEVSNKTRNMEVISYGQISPNTELVVSFEIQGRLQQGKKRLKAGVKFSKGEILYRIDNEEAVYSLSARKMSLSSLVLNALPDIELDFPSEKTKWVDFMNNVDPRKRLPDFPILKSKKEKMFVTSRNILSEYYNLKSTEARMEKYIYAAPFSGTVVEVYAEPGSIANPGGQIAKIAKTGDFEVKVPIDVSDLALYKEMKDAQFTDASGELIGTGRIIRVSDVINQQTQSADVYYSIKPSTEKTIYHGMFVNARIDREASKETMALPRTAVKNNSVKILKDKKLISKDILVVGQKPDTVFVTGLKNGQQVLLEQVGSVENGVIYEGVNR